MRVGSLDVGTVSYGWGVVEFAPIVDQSAASSSSVESILAESSSNASTRASSHASIDGNNWIRVPKASEWKNVGLGDTRLEFLPFAFRLVHWSFESMFDSGSRPTKEQAVAYAVKHPYKQMLM